MTYFPSRKLSYLAEHFPMGMLFFKAIIFSLGNHSDFSVFLQAMELVIYNCFWFLTVCLTAFKMKDIV